MLDSSALRSGLRTPAHGIGTCGNIVILDTTTTGGAYDIRVGWTNVGGNVWEHSASQTGAVTSITSWFGVWVLGAGPTYYRLPYSATPATPGPGECGIGAANTVRINLNGIITPSSLIHLFASFARPEEVEIRNCVGAYTKLAFNGLEGDGIYLDNSSHKCRTFDCAGFYNENHGAFMNDNTECGHFGFFAMGNLNAGIGITRGVNTTVCGSTLVCLPGTKGLNYAVGNVNGRASMNQIIGAGTGIWTSDVGSNTVIEDENVIVNCTTRLTGVSSPGARSSDKSTPITGRGNLVGYRASLAIKAAELAT
jgi:hypothetical protein